MRLNKAKNDPAATLPNSVEASPTGEVKQPSDSHPSETDRPDIANPCSGNGNQCPDISGDADQSTLEKPDVPDGQAGDQSKGSSSDTGVEVLDIPDNADEEELNPFVQLRQSTTDDIGLTLCDTIARLDTLAELAQKYPMPGSSPALRVSGILRVKAAMLSVLMQYRRCGGQWEGNTAINMLVRDIAAEYKALASHEREAKRATPTLVWHHTDHALVHARFIAYAVKCIICECRALRNEDDRKIREAQRVYRRKEEMCRRYETPGPGITLQ